MADNNDRADGGAGSGGTVPILIQEEMQRSYLDYAMSVIVGRAIPDVRDGLKPVHRRILYAMNEHAGSSPARPYKKCARVVGDVLGKYHPHGDTSVYDALVRMAQDFAMRMMLIDGQGNFGSVDGDPAAAMRYTEARLAKIAGELLEDIEKETVDFGANFDASEQRAARCSRRASPTSSSTARAASPSAWRPTSRRTTSARSSTRRSTSSTQPARARLDELMRFVQGPDFPTGGLIYGAQGIEQAYRTGRGSMIMRARGDHRAPRPRATASRSSSRRSRTRSTRRAMIQKIAELVREKRLEGISDLRDESSTARACAWSSSSRRTPSPRSSSTSSTRAPQLQKTLRRHQPAAIVGGRPKVLDLKETLAVFVEHRRDVVTRRTRFELRQAEAQREIVEGLGMATTEIDLVIKTIRESPGRRRRRASAPHAAAAHGPRGRSCGAPGGPRSEIAEAASRATTSSPSGRPRPSSTCASRGSRASSARSSRRSTASCRTAIARLRAILGDEPVLLERDRRELEEMRARYADPRRTEIVADEGEISIEDLIPEEDMVVTFSHEGYIKRTALADYRAQRRGGRGQDRDGGARGGLHHPASSSRPRTTTCSSSPTTGRST